jgi:hypothetical protein
MESILLTKVHKQHNGVLSFKIRIRAATNERGRSEELLSY